MAGEITSATLAQAERIADLELTPAERRQALPRVREQLEGIALRRGAGLRFDEAPAVRFDPRLPGMRFDTRPRRSRRGAGRAPRLPERDEDIAFAPVSVLSRWIERRQLSSTRLTRIYLERLRRLGPRLDCVVTLLEDVALRQARRADREIRAGRYRGPLHGIPWGAKDLLDTKGVPTAWGAEPYRDRVPDRDAAVVRRLEQAGAVLLAKLSLGALAYGDVWYGGTTKNPFNPEQGSSGSSAGSASATAAGLVAFGIGSETLGSIVSPCLRCGTTGLRPTFGRVSRAGAMPLAWSMDKLGPVTRTVEDAALVLEAIAGTEATGEPEPDPCLIDLPFHFDARRSPVGLRVGYVASHFRGQPTSPADRAALRVLEAAGVECVRVRLPGVPLEGLSAILTVEAAATFDELTRSNRDDLLTRQDDAAWPNIFRARRFVPAVELIQAERLRGRAMRELHALLERERLDALLAGGSPIGAPWLVLTNYTGHPSLTLRAGLNGDGTTSGVTLYGRLFDEGTLVTLGLALERALDVWHVRPPLA